MSGRGNGRTCSPKGGLANLDAARPPSCFHAGVMLMAACQSSKLDARVRVSLPAPYGRVTLLSTRRAVLRASQAGFPGGGLVVPRTHSPAARHI